MSRYIHLALGLALVAGAAHGQESLTLAEAARIALDEHPAIEAAAAGENAAGAGVGVARAGLKPRLSWTESYLRSNNPVFAFGTLLNQKRFSEANFAIPALNNPDSVQNFQSLVRVEQTIYDAGRTRRAIEAARLREQLSAEERRARQSDVLLGVVRTYFGAALAAERLTTAEEAVEAAEADRDRAQALYEAGLVTRADALAAEAQLAEAEQERIRAASDAEIARLALNDALGVDLGERRPLATPLAALSEPVSALADYVDAALTNLPELRQADLAADLAAAETRLAKSERGPRVTAQGVFEADRARFVDQGGGNWTAGVSMEWNLWQGSANRHRIEAARYDEERAAALDRQARSQAQLRVHEAWFELQSATERLEVARAGEAQAAESRRIIADRYEAELETVTALLRSQTTSTQARLRRLGALYEQQLARAGLERAAGLLTLSSEVFSQ